NYKLNPVTTQKKGFKKPTPKGKRGKNKKKKMILIGFVLLAFGKTAFGQHLGEFSANYSYMHYVPVDNLPTINLNGGGGAAVLYFAGFFGIKAELDRKSVV